jgi:hypothetical protein
MDRRCAVYHGRWRADPDGRRTIFEQRPILRCAKLVRVVGAATDAEGAYGQYLLEKKRF